MQTFIHLNDYSTAPNDFFNYLILNKPISINSLHVISITLHKTKFNKINSEYFCIKMIDGKKIYVNSHNMIKSGFLGFTATFQGNENFNRIKKIINVQF